MKQIFQFALGLVGLDLAICLFALLANRHEFALFALKLFFWIAALFPILVMLENFWRRRIGHYHYFVPAKYSRVEVRNYWLAQAMVLPFLLVFLYSGWKFLAI